MQNYYYNPIQANTTTRQFIGLKGRPVSSLEEVRAAAVDFDGSVSFFPDLANGKIYTKQCNLDGTAALNMYEIKEIPANTNGSMYVTREEFVKMLVMALGAYNKDSRCGFEDVSEDLWCYPYIASAVSEGLVSGISDSKFGYRAPLTRQDMAVLCYKAAKLDNALEASLPSDEESISEYAKEAVNVLFSAGIISGMGNGEFQPFSNATRAQCAVIINNLLFR